MRFPFYLLPFFITPILAKQARMWYDQKGPCKNIGMQPMKKPQAGGNPDEEWTFSDCRFADDNAAYQVGFEFNGDCYRVTSHDVTPGQGGLGTCNRRPKVKAGGPVQEIPDADVYIKKGGYIGIGIEAWSTCLLLGGPGKFKSKVWRAIIDNKLFPVRRRPWTAPVGYYPGSLGLCLGQPLARKRDPSAEPGGLEQGRGGSSRSRSPKTPPSSQQRYRSPQRPASLSPHRQSSSHSSGGQSGPQPLSSPQNPLPQPPSPLGQRPSSPLPSRGRSSTSPQHRGSSSPPPPAPPSQWQSSPQARPLPPPTPLADQPAVPPPLTDPSKCANPATGKSDVPYLGCVKDPLAFAYEHLDQCFKVGTAFAAPWVDGICHTSARLLE